MADPETGMAFRSDLYKAFFDNATLSDLTILLSDRSVRVHRIVLCRRSEYFTTLLTGSFQVCSHHTEAKHGPALINVTGERLQRD